MGSEMGQVSFEGNKEECSRPRKTGIPKKNENRLRKVDVRHGLAGIQEGNIFKNSASQRDEGHQRFGKKRVKK